MKVAELTAELSYAERLKVGSVIVKDDRIISCGYNGLPAGWDNRCEKIVHITNEQYYSLTKEEQSRYKQVTDDIRYWSGLKTFDEVIHSEMNCLGQLTRSSISGEGCIMFCTHSPCVNCAKSIYVSGISELYYKHDYRDSAGIEFLDKCGIKIHKFTD